MFGPGVIPVLEMRKKATGGGLTKWEVFETQKKCSEPAVEKDNNMHGVVGHHFGVGQGGR